MVANLQAGSRVPFPASGTIAILDIVPFHGKTFTVYGSPRPKLDRTDICVRSILGFLRVLTRRSSISRCTRFAESRWESDYAGCGSIRSVSIDLNAILFQNREFRENVIERETSLFHLIDDRYKMKHKEKERGRRGGRRERRMVERNLIKNVQ